MNTYLLGVTEPVVEGLWKYLKDTGQQEFWEDFDESSQLGPMRLVSFYAKLCYRSLVEGKNANVSRVRGIQENIEGCFKSGHGSVFEHVWLNFVTTGCSRMSWFVTVWGQPSRRPAVGTFPWIILIWCYRLR